MFLHLSVILFIGGSLQRGSLSRGVSVHWALCPGGFGFCPGGFGFCPGGGVSVEEGGFCPGGLCPEEGLCLGDLCQGGNCPGGLCPEGVSVRQRPLVR